jgi:hypothetical protein
MRIKNIPTAFVAFTLCTCALTSQANDNNTDHNWMPKQPSNSYWQGPNWSQPSYKSAQPVYTPPAPPIYNDTYRRPAVPAQRPQNPGPNVNDTTTPVQSSSRDYPPPPGPYSGALSRANTPRANTPSRANSRPPAYYNPDYNRYRNKGRNKNKFWGRSGPGTWMNPNKGNMDRGWDDMINAPSRMGRMPGGWTAPEVTMPNPVDIGDQMQDNVEDLPDQMRDMDVGN